MRVALALCAAFPSRAESPAAQTKAVQVAPPQGGGEGLVKAKTASMVIDLSTYRWQDSRWMSERVKRNALESPMSFYEVHLGSWRRPGDDPTRWSANVTLTVPLFCGRAITPPNRPVQSNICMPRCDVT